MGFSVDLDQDPTQYAMSFQDRAGLMSNQTARDICNYAFEKQTNLCVAVDSSLADAIRIIELIGDKICVLKTQVKMYEDFTEEEAKRLAELAKEKKVILFEDSKFNDIGKSAKAHYIGGIFKIAEWARLSNCMTMSGPDILKAFKEGIKETAATVKEAAQNAFLIVAEMSSKDNLFPLVVDKIYNHALRHTDLVVGFIAQRTFGNPFFLTFTPGVNIEQTGDALGQQYNTPESAIQRGTDIIIVGTGICKAQDIVATAEIYRSRGWNAHQLLITDAKKFSRVFR